MDAQKIGNTIAFLRKQTGMTQAQLADRLGITDKAVSRWERGIGSPDISLLTRVSAVLDTDIEAILEGNFILGEADYKGLLCMDYPDGIHADTFLYTKRVVYFQLSFFLLAGIRELCVRGSEADVMFVESDLHDGSSLGIRIVYERAEKSGLDYRNSDFFKEWNKTNPLLVIDGLDFLYGKGITSSLKRLLYDSVSCITVMTYKKGQTSFKFFPPGARVRNQKSGGAVPFSSFLLGRGVICFPIEDERSLFDAGNIIRIVEDEMHESVADLHEIARNRGFIK